MHNTLKDYRGIPAGQIDKLLPFEKRKVTIMGISLDRTNRQHVINGETKYYSELRLMLDIDGHLLILRHLTDERILLRYWRHPSEFYPSYKDGILWTLRANKKQLKQFSDELSRKAQGASGEPL